MGFAPAGEEGGGADDQERQRGGLGETGANTLLELEGGDLRAPVALKTAAAQVVPGFRVFLDGPECVRVGGIVGDGGVIAPAGHVVGIDKRIVLVFALVEEDGGYPLV